MSSFQAVSVRVGELRLEDLGAIVVDADVITVLALSSAGVPVFVEVTFTGKWGGAGWQHAFECPLCGLAARVLAIDDHVAACGRCRRRRTVQSRQKNVRAWREGELADELTRFLLGRRIDVAQMRRTARKLRSRTVVRGQAALARAEAALAAANRALSDRHA